MATVLGNVAVCAVVTACAGFSAPYATAAPFRTQVTHEEELFRLSDQRTGKVLIETDDTSFHYYLSRRRASLEPQVEIVPFANGFNAVFTYTNDRTQPMPLGAMEIKGLMLGDTYAWRDFEFDGGRRQVSPAHPVNKFRFGYPHGPNKHYSPVAVMETDSHVIGFNLLFPVLELEHETLGTLARVGGDPTGDEWKFRWKLSNYGNEGASRAMDYEAMLPPGEKRSYTIAVRVTDDHDNWLETITPYRDYFTKMHGGVTYERDPRPVMPISLAGEGNLSAQNPYGFRQENRRPDLYGWGPLLEWIGERDLHGKRVMFWQPSGVQRFHRDHNFPYKFASFWGEGDTYGHAMGDAPVEFRRFAEDNDTTVAFWWGQSTLVTSTWDSGEVANFDIENPTHVALGFREVDAAVAAGATCIGLDAFGSNGGTPAWDLAKWLTMLNERHPQVTFVTEKHKPDILHRLGATFFQAYNKSRDEPSSLEEVRFIDEPHYLADFILPGHETWLSFRFEIPGRVPGVTVTDSFRANEFNRALEMGYVPLMFGGFDWNQSDVARESWRYTVPNDLAGPEDPVAPTDDAGAEVPQNEPPQAVRGGRTVRTYTKPGR